MHGELSGEEIDNDEIKHEEYNIQHAADYFDFEPYSFSGLDDEPVLIVQKISRPGCRSIIKAKYNFKGFAYPLKNEGTASLRLSLSAQLQVKYVTRPLQLFIKLKIITYNLKNNYSVSVIYNNYKKMLNFYNIASHEFLMNFYHKFLRKGMQSGLLHIASSLFSIFHKATPTSISMLIKFDSLIREAL